MNINQTTQTPGASAEKNETNAGDTAGSRRPVTLIGIGDDGCAGLDSRSFNALNRAQVLVGGERQLGFFPDFTGRKIVLKSGLVKALGEIKELADENSIAVLASGDPLFYGVGSLLIKKLGADQVEIIPSLSSIQLAFAKAGLKWDDARLLSLHARPLEGFMTRLRRIRKLGILTDDTNTPPAIARYMLDFGEKNWRAFVCENLHGPGERVRAYEDLESLAREEDIGSLNVLILERMDTNWRPEATLLNFHEDSYGKRVPKKGLITKKETRLLSVGELRVRPDAVIWDIGAASGSVAIECALLAPEGRAYAIELDPESLEYCRENLLAFGVDNVRVLEGRAPEILSEIEDDPDAVFIGGSKGSLGQIIQTALERLKPGGRLVANAITFENIQEAYATFKELGIQPEIMQLNVSRAVPLARFMRYEAQNPIHIFSITKPEQS